MPDYSLPFPVTSGLAYGPWKLSSLVAECASFQARVKVNDFSGACQFVKRTMILDVGDFDGLSRPIAIVGRGKFSFDLNAYQVLVPDVNTLWLTLTDWDRFPDKPDLSAFDFEQWAGSVLDEMQDLQGTDDPPSATGHLALKTISIDDRPRFSHPQSTPPDKAYWTAFIRCEVKFP